MMVLGLVILRRAIRGRTPSEPPQKVRMLGLAGGFLDAIGGGGWGPMVASTLIGRGSVPRVAIGSTNAAEFFVTFAASIVFLLSLGVSTLWPVILGLVLGGVIAAPFAALITKKLPDRPLMIMVGVVIFMLSLRNLIRDANWLMGA
jgi:uncharacterized membrane protein YfcA